jgi:hypothetical protein
MRPEEARRLIDNAFKPFYKQQVRLRPVLDGFFDKRVLDAVFEMLKRNERQDKKWAKDSGIEYKPVEMYYENVIDSEEGVLGTMFYISDRWNCTGRLKFLIRVLELY